MQYKLLGSKNVITEAERIKQVQANEIALQKWVATKIDTRIRYAQPRYQNIGLSNQWWSDWILMNSLSIESVVYTTYYQWKILIGEIDPDWISQFQVEMVCKNGVNGEIYSPDFQAEASGTLNKFVGWELEETTPGSSIKKVYLVATISNVTLNTPVFYVKLIVNYKGQSKRN